MYQIRIHGRGGQGVVTAAELLSVAAFRDGKYSQAFPSFGSERTGAPVTAFCRISEKTIRIREPITNPDVLIIQDSTLLHQVDVFGGLLPRGFVLINTSRNVEELSIAEFLLTFPHDHVFTVPATDIAMRYLGRPIANAALVAGFAAMTKWITLQSVLDAINEKFPGETGTANVSTAKAAYEYVRGHLLQPQEVRSC